MDTLCPNLDTMNKEVLLIYTQRYIPGRKFEKIGNLGILTLATRLADYGFKAYTFTGITTDAVNLIKERWAHLFSVCFYCDFDNQTAVAGITASLKNAPFYVVIGGPQTMHLGGSFLEISKADAILCGEGEEILGEWLLSKYSKKKTGPLAEEIKKDEKGVYVIINNFSKYPYPDDKKECFRQQATMFSVITARGCPHRCTFCFEGGHAKKLRLRPVEAVLDEIWLRLETNPDYRYLFFTDDTFTFDKKRLYKLIDGMKELRKIRDFVWFCEGHASFFKCHPEVIKDMVDAGMVRMQIGMESSNDHILKAYKKGIQAQDIQETARMCFEADLPQLAGNFIIGGAFETPQTLKNTTSFVLDLMNETKGMIDVSTTFPMPLIGTKLTEQPECFDIIWEEKSYLTSIEDFPVNRTKEMTRIDICQGRSLFLSKVSEKMKKMYNNGDISDQRIRRSFELAFHYGLVDAWFRYIYIKERKLVAYYTGIMQDHLLEWENIKNEREEVVYPVKVLSDEELLNEELTELEWNVYRHIGRSSLSNIKKQLEVFIGQEKEKAVIEKLSKKHLLLFLVIDVLESV